MAVTKLGCSGEVRVSAWPDFISYTPLSFHRLSLMHRPASDDASLRELQVNTFSHARKRRDSSRLGKDSWYDENGRYWGCDSNVWTCSRRQTTVERMRKSAVDCVLCGTLFHHLEQNPRCTEIAQTLDLDTQILLLELNSVLQAKLRVELVTSPPRGSRSATLSIDSMSDVIDTDLGLPAYNSVQATVYFTKAHGSYDEWLTYIWRTHEFR